VKTSNLRRAGMLAAGIGILTASMATASADASPASISQGRIQLCSQGNYGSWLAFSAPDTGSIGTDTVGQGACTTFDVPGAAEDKWTVTIKGVYNSNGTSFTIGQTQSGPTHAGLKIATLGTTTSPGWKFNPNT
jgi:hypothetical protein